MNFPLQLKRLRDKLDPFRWSVWRWPETIKNAEIWLKEEKKVLPGSPPKGARIKASVRLQEIDRLQVMGKSKIEIAKELDITSNYLSVYSRDSANKK